MMRDGKKDEQKDHSRFHFGCEEVTLHVTWSICLSVGLSVCYPFAFLRFSALKATVPCFFLFLFVPGIRWTNLSC